MEKVDISKLGQEYAKNAYAGKIYKEVVKSLIAIMEGELSIEVLSNVMLSQAKITSSRADKYHKKILEYLRKKKEDAS